MKEPNPKLIADRAIVLLVQSLQETWLGSRGLSMRKIAEAVVLLNQLAERENFASEDLDSIFKDCHEIAFEKMGLK